MKRFRQTIYFMPEPQVLRTHEAPMQSDPSTIKALLMQQWSGLTEEEIEATEYKKSELAMLLEDRYSIHHQLAENYLNNLERTLPHHAMH